MEYNDNRLISFSWYWGTMDKNETQKLMQGLSHGFYLVRNSISDRDKTPYTLCVRINGNTKLFKIYNDANRFDIKPDCRFDSLEKLITYYQKHDLNEHFEIPSVKLSYVVVKETDELLRSSKRSTLCRTSIVVRIASQELSPVEHYLNQNKFNYDFLEDIYSNIHDEKLIELYKKVCLKEESIIKLLESNNEKMIGMKDQQDEIYKGIRVLTCIDSWQTNHAKLIMHSCPDKNKTEVHNEFHRTSCSDSLKILTNSMNDCQKNLKDLRSDKDAIMRKISKLYNKISENTKLLEKSVKKHYSIKSEIMKRGVKEEQFYFDDPDDDKYFSNLSQQLLDFNPWNNQSLWFCEVSKKQSIEMLMSTASETFLIRPSESVFGYTLDIKYIDTVKHLRILLSKDGSCKFGKFEQEFPSLKHLVNYFHHNNLNEFKLSTKLKYTIGQYGISY